MGGISSLGTKLARYFKRRRDAATLAEARPTAPLRNFF
jgi:hypothetical protein